MTLKRSSPLIRRTPLQQRTQTRARTSRTPLKATPARRAVVRGRETGPTLAQRNLVLYRAIGYCEICGRRLATWDHTGKVTWHETHSIHHRRPRGMGGTRREDTNSPANLLLLCGDATSPYSCHAQVESSRARAYRNGWLVRSAADPAQVPVLLEGSGWFLLGHDGARTPTFHPIGDDQ